MHQVELNEWASPVSVVVLVTLTFVIAMINYRLGYMYSSYDYTRDSIAEAMQQVGPEVEKFNAEDGGFVVYDDWGIQPQEEQSADANPTIDAEVESADHSSEHVMTMNQADMTKSMTEVYGMNPDCVGWLKIDGTVIDYPLMQTLDDEQYYLNRDFNKKYSAYGSLIADTDSVIGSGTKINDYADGTLPSTNIIIHGHNMKNGSMFGSLDKYRDQAYEKKHSIIKLSSLYEDREYEICAVFLSQVYKKSDNVFKYYKFFQANNEEEFNDFYDNIKSLSMYDTGVTAAYGDEFITLSVCAYHVENGRLVVVGKRIK